MKPVYPPDDYSPVILWQLDNMDKDHTRREAEGYYEPATGRYRRYDEADQFEKRMDRLCLWLLLSALGAFAWYFSQAPAGFWKGFFGGMMR